MLRSTALFVLALTATPAIAVPDAFHHQGRLFDALGAPLSGDLPVTFAVYDTAAGGTPIWSDTPTVTFDAGYYAITLDGLDPADFDDDDRYLGIAVDSGAEISPRIQLESVPFAFRANDSTNVSGGTVDASELTVGGTTIVDDTGTFVATVPWSNLGSVPAEITSVTDGLDFSDIGGTAAISQLPVGTTSSHVAAGDHVHDMSNYYTRTEVDALLAANAEPGGVPSAWQATGATDACHAAATGYETVPDMNLNFDLDGDYVVLVQFDYNVVGASGAWAATRLNIDGSPDASAIHSQPQGSGGEDDHVQLFRIAQLGAGSHTISAEWGQGSGQVCNYAANGTPVWTRRISAYAIPVETGVEFGYKTGSSGDVCHNASATTWSTVGDMTETMDISEDSIVLSMFTYNVSGASGAWTGSRIAIDGASDGGTHTQPIGGGSETDVHNLFQLNALDAGSYTLTGEWGEGGGAVCNTLSAAAPFDRRIGWVAIPRSTGVVWGYANPKTNAVVTSTTYASTPGLSYQLDLGLNSNYVANSIASLNWWPSANNNWGSMRFNIDLLGEARGTHVQPSGAGEDDIVSQHRIDQLSPGMHRIDTEWRAGSGQMNGDASNAASIWHRRMATIALPEVSYR